MTPVECSNANGECKVEWLFPWFELEVLERDLTEAETPGRDLGSRPARRLCDGFR
jgi:hypothetical protein